MNYPMKCTLRRPFLHIHSVGRPASASGWGRTVNQRSVGKARERWHEQGCTCALVAGLYWCVGLLLPTGVVGDGCISKHSGTSDKNNYHYTTNCIHKEYVEYKAALLGDLVTKVTSNINGGYKKGVIHKLYTRARKDITDVKNDSLEGNLNKLDDLGMALWFYDDGSFHHKNHYYNLCTHAFSKADHLDVIIPFLSKRLDVSVSLRTENKRDGRKFYYCCINKLTGAPKISKLLSQFPIDCYKYKIGPY